MSEVTLFHQLQYCNQLIYCDWPLFCLLISQMIFHTASVPSTCQRCIEWERSTKLTHPGRVTHIYVAKLTIIGADNGLSPGWCQAIISTKATILLIESLTNFCEILTRNENIFVEGNMFENVAKCCPFRVDLNVFTRESCVRLWNEGVQGYLV